MSTHMHGGHDEAPDPVAQIIGVQASVLAVCLAFVTIASHRSHTHGIISEGIFEVALIVTSLFFISRKKLFPVLGILAGVGGGVAGVPGLLSH